MKILIGCEFSARVRDAFRRRNHDAWSCDLLPCEGDPEFHYQEDIAGVLYREQWDMVIAFPPCTYLTLANNLEWPPPGDAVDFFLNFADWHYATGRPVAIENPVGWMNSNYRKPDQIINPNQFGDPYRKRTCLWLFNLPPLKPTDIVPGIPMVSSGHRGNDNAYEDSEGRARRHIVRSRTFPGIAQAMAEQWG